MARRTFIMRLSVAHIFVFFFFTALAGDPSAQEYGTGEHFLEICEQPESDSCQTFISGFFLGVLTTVQAADNASTFLKKACREGSEWACSAAPSVVVTKLFQGCALEVNKLSLSDIVTVVSNYIRSRPGLSRLDFGRLYRDAISTAFACGEK